MRSHRHADLCRHCTCCQGSPGTPARQPLWEPREPPRAELTRPSAQVYVQCSEAAVRTGADRVGDSQKCGSRHCGPTSTAGAAPTAMDTGGGGRAYASNSLVARALTGPAWRHVESDHRRRRVRAPPATHHVVATTSFDDRPRPGMATATSAVVTPGKVRPRTAGMRRPPLVQRVASEPLLPPKRGREQPGSGDQSVTSDSASRDEQFEKEKQEMILQQQLEAIRRRNRRRGRPSTAAGFLRPVVAGTSSSEHLSTAAAAAVTTTTRRHRPGSPGGVSHLAHTQSTSRAAEFTGSEDELSVSGRVRPRSAMPVTQRAQSELVLGSVNDYVLHHTQRRPHNISAASSMEKVPSYSAFPLARHPAAEEPTTTTQGQQTDGDELAQRHVELCQTLDFDEMADYRQWVRDSVDPLIARLRSAIVRQTPADIKAFALAYLLAENEPEIGPETESSAASVSSHSSPAGGSHDDGGSHGESTRSNVSRTFVSGASCGSSIRDLAQADVDDGDEESAPGHANGGGGAAVR